MRDAGQRRRRNRRGKAKAKAVVGKLPLDRPWTALGKERTSSGGHPGVALWDTGRDGCPDSRRCAQE